MDAITKILFAPDIKFLFYSGYLKWKFEAGELSETLALKNLVNGSTPVPVGWTGTLTDYFDDGTFLNHDYRNPAVIARWYYDIQYDADVHPLMVTVGDAWTIDGYFKIVTVPGLALHEAFISVNSTGVGFNPICFISGYVGHQNAWQSYCPAVAQSCWGNTAVLINTEYYVCFTSDGITEKCYVDTVLQTATASTGTPAGHGLLDEFGIASDKGAVQFKQKTKALRLLKREITSQEQSVMYNLMKTHI